MSTTASRTAYRELQAKRLKEAQIRAYGMVPVAARFPGRCGCGNTNRGAQGRNACAYDRGYLIVKFRGAWWNASCVDQIKTAEFQASARWVLEERFSNRNGQEAWQARFWSDRQSDMEQWRRMLSDDERIIDRKEAQ